jgi:dimeric dUTPase (all-alpha-NTP-PPase superfamily)
MNCAIAPGMASDTVKLKVTEGATESRCFTYWIRKFCTLRTLRRSL